ncbi:MAG: universal stress protein [Acidimicrobiia bacterium]|nr:universal stress protein [Acidimicrobiia bacterium]
MSGILVGVDGSVGSARALQWAVDEAAIRGVDVDVVHAYKNEYIYYVDIPVTAMAIPRPEVEASAEAIVQKAVDSVENPKSVTINVACVNRANAAKELVERSPDHDLLVIGSRGFGGLTGLLVGSVAMKVIHHAECPVVIIPAAKG